MPSVQTQPSHSPGRLRLHRIGSLIAGNYRVEQFLGQGGLGAAYEVEHRESRARWICTEMDLLGGIGDRDRAQLVEEFQREGRLLKRMRDSSLPPMETLSAPFDRPVCGVCGNSFPGVTTCPICRPPVDSPWFGLVSVVERHYLLVRQIPGKTLSERYQSSGRPMAWPEALGWFAQLASGVAEMHRHEVLHLNIKPENVLLEAATGRAFLLDLGLVKCVDPPGRTNGTQLLSARTMSIGTTGYAAPELYRGMATPATDVYALGMLLCWALTGRDPVEKDHELELLSTPPAGLAPGLPPHVSEAIARSIRRVPAERFDSIDDLMQAVEGAPGQVGAVAPPPTVVPTVRPEPVEEPPPPRESPSPDVARASADEAPIFLSVRPEQVEEPPPAESPPPPAPAELEVVRPTPRIDLPARRPAPMERSWPPPAPPRGTSVLSTALPLGIASIVLVLWGVMAISANQTPRVAQAAAASAERPIVFSVPAVAEVTAPAKTQSAPPSAVATSPVVAVAPVRLASIQPAAPPSAPVRVVHTAAPEKVGDFTVGETSAKPAPVTSRAREAGVRDERQTLAVLTRALEEASRATERLLRIASGTKDPKEMELAVAAQQALEWLHTKYLEAKGLANDRERPEFKTAQTRMMDAYIELGDRNIELGQYQRKQHANFPWVGWDDAVTKWPATRATLVRQIEAIRKR